MPPAFRCCGHAARSTGEKPVIVLFEVPRARHYGPSATVVTRSPNPALTVMLGAMAEAWERAKQGRVRG